jgi:hypothetical protein
MMELLHHQRSPEIEDLQMSAQLSAAPAAASPKARWVTRAGAVGLAALAAALVWVVVDPLLGVDLAVTRSGTTTVVGPGLAVGMALGAALLGWAFLAVLERFTSRAERVWTITAVAVLLLSFAMPFNSGEADTSAKWSLLVMHLAVGAVLIPLLSRNSRS